MASGRDVERHLCVVAALLLLTAAVFVAGCATHRGEGAPNPPTDDDGAFVPAPSDTVLVLAHPPKADELPLPPILTEPYRIAPNDVLTIHVLANPALTKTARVRPDGRITVPGVGEVLAADREPSDLAREIEQGLADLVLQPQVSVAVDDFGPFIVYVLGEVQRAGSVEVRRDMTVLGAIAAAGGANDRAQMGSVVLIRRLKDGEAVAVRLDMRDPLKGRDLSRDIPVSMYDIVVVPRSFIAKMETFMTRFFGSAQRPLDLYLRGWEAFNVNRIYPVRVVTVSR